MIPKKKLSLSQRIKQLPACSLCASTGGLWRIDDNGNMKRCVCLRGVLLRKADEFFDAHFHTTNVEV